MFWTLQNLSQIAKKQHSGQTRSIQCHFGKKKEASNSILIITSSVLFQSFSITILMRWTSGYATATCERSPGAEMLTSWKHGGCVWCQTGGSLYSTSGDGPRSHQSHSPSHPRRQTGRMGLMAGHSDWVLYHVFCQCMKLM